MRSCRSLNSALDLLARKAGEAREPHVENRLRLDLREPELAPSAPSRADSVLSEPRMSTMIASMLSSAIR